VSYLWQYVRLKLAEQTRLSVLCWAVIIITIGFPPEVVNIVNGISGEGSSAIVKHPSVVKIAFTGSTVIRKTIMRSGADTRNAITLGTG
jgi:acyl-CoA reductase-like NAD-dependent aldehyde dehydrogenase